MIHIYIAWYMFNGLFLLFVLSCMGLFADRTTNQINSWQDSLWILGIVFLWPVALTLGVSISVISCGIWIHQKFPRIFPPVPWEK